MINSLELIIKKFQNKNALSVLVLRFTGALLLFVFNYLLVRFLGPNDSGVIFLSITIVNIVALLSLFGIDQYILRKIPSLNKGEVRSYFIRSIQIVLALSFVTTILLIIMAKPLENAFNISNLSTTLGLLSLSIPLLNLSIFLAEVLRSKNKFLQAVFIGTNLFYILAILLFIFTNTLYTADLKSISIAYLVSAFIYTFISVLIFNKIFRLKQIRELTKIYNKVDYKIVAFEGHTLFWVSVFYLSMSWVDIIIVGFFLDPVDVSIYSIAVKIAKLMTFPLFAINTIIAPKIVKYHQNKDSKALDREAKNSTYFNIVFGAPLLIVLFVFASFVLGIFGPEYSEGTSALRILLVGQAINAFTGSIIVILIMLGLDNKVNILSMLAISLQITLGAVLTIKFGYTGTAIATAIAGAFLNIGGVIYLYKKYGFSTLPFLKPKEGIV